MEYRLDHDEEADEWRVHAGDVLLADHDCLTADAVDAAVAWASSVLADEGIATAGWDARVGSDGPLEYVAALAASAGDHRG